MASKMTKDDFIKKAKEIWGDKYNYSLVEYVNMKEKIDIIYNNWIFKQSPMNHLLGKKCELIWNTERFIYESKKIWGDKYDYSKVVLKSMNEKVIIIYNGVEYQQNATKHLMGRRCEKSIVLKTTDEFIKEAKAVWGDKYDYSLVEYKNSKKLVKIIFKNKIYFQKPTQHLLGYRCERDSIKNQDDFLRKCIERHGNKYDYSLVEYKGSQNKVKIIFNGVIYEQKAGAHLWSKGLVENVIKKRTTEEFIEIANDIHSNKYNYDKVDYINNNNYVIINCPYHGDFKQSPRSHLSGAGCPNCQESKGEKKIKKFLDRYNIKYTRQKKFDKCVSNNGRKLPYDFWIPSMNICIEFDGIQHFKPVDIFGGNESYQKQLENDQIKNKYCEENYINILRIRYDQYNQTWDILWSNLGMFIRKSKLEIS